MYSRYSGYRPFVPMNNRLSRGGGDAPRQAPGYDDGNEREQYPLAADAVEQTVPPEQPPAAQAVPAALAAAASAPQKGFLESLFGGGQNRGRRGGHGGGFGNLGNLGSLGDLGGIADLLRSGGGGIARLLQNFAIDWDAGDILMVLILLFMSLESDDDEILILLALVLVMGL